MTKEKNRKKRKKKKKEKEKKKKKQGKFWDSSGSSSNKITTSTPLLVDQPPDDELNLPLSKSSESDSSGIVFGYGAPQAVAVKGRVERLKSSLYPIPEEHELKEPLSLIASTIEALGEKVDELGEKVDELGKGLRKVCEDVGDLRSEMQQNFRKLDMRISSLVGSNKGTDDIATIMEVQAQSWLEKKHGRTFEHSFSLKYADKSEEEIDLYSAPAEEGGTHIICECTIVLRSIEKINSAIRKRNGIADKFCKKDLKKTRLYIFAIRINKDLEDSIIQMVTANGIELRLCEDISHALEFYELPMKEGKQRPVTPCMDIPGNQPLDGIMKCSEMNEDLDGYPNVGHIQIEYMFPDGVQSDAHPNPGTAYTGVHEVCYLPNNDEGRVIKDLLRAAFNRHLVFTVNQDKVTWTGIHHKSSRTGGPLRGYPDSTYLERMKLQLAAVGITKDR